MTERNTTDMVRFDDRELRRRVDEVLYYVWDPIGVSREPFARAEYMNYVPKVLQLVEQNDNPQPISDYLVEVIRERMELTPDRAHCDCTAALLLRHKDAIKQGIA